MEALQGDEFRVLILLPGVHKEPLRCSLTTSTLTNPPPYEALSYVWGNPNEKVEIEVAGQPLAITRSLEAILFDLRQQSEPRTLWIDQLCIDQSNPAEKTSQVQKMRLIYSSCEHSLIWLSEITEGIRREDAEDSFAVIEYIAAFARGNSTSVLPRPQCMSSDKLFNKAMEAFSTISVAKCPWWHRVWTVQEAIIPKDALFVWGPLTLSWATATSAATIWTPWVNNRDTTIGTCGNGEGMSLQQLKTAISVGDINRLITLVIWMNTPGNGRDTPIAAPIKWRDRRATDPRDSVYALTGLYPPGRFRMSSKCDYSLTVNEVFINFTLDFIFRNEGNTDLEPLTFDPRLGDGTELMGLPRWAIDMRSVPKYNTGLWRAFWFWGVYAANKGLPRAVEPEYTGENLRTPGVFVDTVDVVGSGLASPTINNKDQPPSPTDDHGLHPRIRDTIISWWNLLCNDESQHLPASFSRVNPTNCGRYDEFCRLVLGDTLGDNNHRADRKATNKDRQDLSDYLETGSDNGIMRTHARHQLRNRKFFVTKKGLIGLGHLETLRGDEVWVLNHSTVPFTLRRRGDPGDPASENRKDYDFGGSCYVQGIMKGLGQALADLEQCQVCLY